MGILLKKDSLLTKFANNKRKCFNLHSSKGFVIQEIRSTFNRYLVIFVMSISLICLSEREKKNLILVFTGPDNEKFVLIASKLVKEY